MYNPETDPSNSANPLNPMYQQSQQAAEIPKTPGALGGISQMVQALAHKHPGALRGLFSGGQGTPMATPEFSTASPANPFTAGPGGGQFGMGGGNGQPQPPAPPPPQPITPPPPPPPSPSPPPSPWTGGAAPLQSPPGSDPMSALFTSPPQ